jgi:hypothetical protein
MFDISNKVMLAVVTPVCKAMGNPNGRAVFHVQE